MPLTIGKYAKPISLNSDVVIDRMILKKNWRNFARSRSHMVSDRKSNQICKCRSRNIECLNQHGSCERLWNWWFWLRTTNNQCVQTASMDRNAVRSVYLLTYSQANNEKFRTREDFSSALVNSFASGTASLLQWCCSLESHQNSGVHYHMCVKSDRNQR